MYLTVKRSHKKVKKSQKKSKEVEISQKKVKEVHKSQKKSIEMKITQNINHRKLKKNSRKKLTS